MICKYIWIFTVIILLSAPCVCAQETSEFRISGAEGEAFLLIAGDQRNLYRPENIAGEGFSLRPGDAIQTGGGSFVTVTILPGGTEIRIAENTFLSFLELGGGGGPVILRFDYGRILISGSRDRTLMVHSRAVNVLYEGGEVGIDYTFSVSQDQNPSETKDPVLHVYNFSGSAALLSPQNILNNTAVPPQIAVYTGEVLTMEISGTFSYVERKPISVEIADYWNRRAVNSSAFVYAPGQTVSAEIAESEARQDENSGGVTWSQDIDFNSFKRINRLKNASLLSGTALFLLGSALQGYAAYRMTNDGGERARNLFMMSYTPVGIGVTLLVFSLFHNPQYPSQINGAK
jgi:hypothetical protein